MKRTQYIFIDYENVCESDIVEETILQFVDQGILFFTDDDKVIYKAA